MDLVQQIRSYCSRFWHWWTKNPWNLQQIIIKIEWFQNVYMKKWNQNWGRKKANLFNPNSLFFNITDRTLTSTPWGPIRFLCIKLSTNVANSSGTSSCYIQEFNTYIFSKFYRVCYTSRVKKGLKTGVTRVARRLDSLKN